MLGSLHGTVNHDPINRTHPAMLAVHRCNPDVQLPSRVPGVKETHCCADGDCLTQDDDMIIKASQIGQHLQAGYACDYCKKRQPMAFNEGTEYCKGHHTLLTQLATSNINTIGERHATNC